MGRGQTGHFLELGAEMCDTAVVQFERDFGQRKFVVDKKFLNPFNFVGNKEFLDGCALYFGKEIGEIGVIVLQLFRQVAR